jgi:hypothetical protein
MIGKKIIPTPAAVHGGRRFRNGGKKTLKLPYKYIVRNNIKK